MEAMRGYLLRDVQREKTLGSTDAGLSFLEVTTEEHRQAAAALPERAIERAATQHHSIACLGSFLITVTLYKRWPPPRNQPRQSRTDGRFERRKVTKIYILPSLQPGKSVTVRHHILTFTTRQLFFICSRARIKFAPDLRLGLCFSKLCFAK